MVIIGFISRRQNMVVFQGSNLMRLYFKGITGLLGYDIIQRIIYSIYMYISYTDRMCIIFYGFFVIIRMILSHLFDE